MKKYIVPLIIKDLLHNFIIKEKSNRSKFFFYDSFTDSNIISRTNIIKNNISNMIKQCYFLTNIKMLLIIHSFSKTRRSKRLNQQYFFLFDKDYKIGQNDISLNEHIKNNTLQKQNIISLYEKEESINENEFFSFEQLRKSNELNFSILSNDSINFSFNSIFKNNIENQEN